MQLERNKSIIERMRSGIVYQNIRSARTGKKDSTYSGGINPDPTDGLADGYIWVRDGENGDRGQTVAIIVGIRSDIADIPILIGERTTDGSLCAIGPDINPKTVAQYGGGLPATGVPNQPVEWQRTIVDGLYLNVGRVRPSLLNPETLYVHIEPFLHNGRWYGGIDHDVGSGNVPGSATQARWCIVALDDSNTAYTHAGTITTIASVDYLPTSNSTYGLDSIAVPAGRIPVGAFTLAYGQTVIKDSRFVDPRDWIAPRGTLLSEDSTTLTISSGAVTAGSGSFFVLAAQSGTADDLDTITASGIPRMIVVQADSGDTITVKHSTGNIELNGAVDVALSGDKTLALFFDGTNWADTAVVGSGSAGTTYYFEATSDMESIGASPGDITFSFTSGNVTRNDGSCWDSGAVTEISAPVAGVYQLTLYLTPDDVAYANISGTLRMDRYDSGDTLVETIVLLVVYNAEETTNALTSNWIVSLVRHFDAGDYGVIVFNDQAATNYGPFWTLEKLTWLNLVAVT